jgi:2-dehydro-3-deoxyphosphooctonate aldolase (KDO 8-P synthase)
MRKTEKINIGGVEIGGDAPLAFIAGPCVIESRDAALRAADALRSISEKEGIALVFKASYDKANRTSISSYRGPGIDEGLDILADVKRQTGLPVLTDVHSPEEARAASQVVDVLQIPAFLCRQTDLVVEAARTGLPVNIKKGQFMAPDDMEHIAAKAASVPNGGVLLTERGVSFGYHNLVVDMRSIPIMKSSGYPVIFDATHSVQLPGGAGASSGGQREFAGILARAAVSAGCDGIFMEVHEDPDRALCDGPNMVRMSDFGRIAVGLIRLKEFIREWDEVS